MIKMLRLIKGFELFDVHNMMQYVKGAYNKRMQHLIENDPEEANDVDIDNTGIGEILAI